MAKGFRCPSFARWATEDRQVSEDPPSPDGFDTASPTLVVVLVVVLVLESLPIHEDEDDHEHDIDRILPDGR